MRIKINLPKLFPTTFQIPVRITDINYGSHVGNNSLVSIIHESRMQWLTSHKFTELNIEGVGLIMADLAVEFINQSFYGDEIIVNLGVGEITKVSFELYYQLKVMRNNNELIIAKAKSGMVCFNYINKKITSIPEKLINILKK